MNDENLPAAGRVVAPIGTVKGTSRLAASTPHQARTTAIIQFHYNRDGSHEPRSLEGKFYRLHKDKIAPHDIELEIGEEWEKLDVGKWKEAGTLFLKNEEGKFLYRMPSEEEKAEAAGKIIEVGVYVAKGGKEPKVLSPIVFAYVDPSSVLPLRPADLARYYVRASKGPINARLVLLPF